ncbi:MerR family transcriptional regulator [Petrocella atlantisensis]|uniref:MerR family transcriptional regulator n=1 Tax=Petrocella atlantisensis TaxID=2173034 RepID=A0A3P7S0U1_9FIRM|nr:MerR family transcriptional regulator [Petrocella atlantisensis]PKM55000.1 MAG: MerR family transcriptional regulator [Firmicutes bacterium HGW-Firmicutes-5]VDN48332.1 MerR family transcriptional regulator [Petrocella atlantisensis]
MKKTYTTSEVAHIIGIHPNTVRLYETLELIPKVKRKKNGYRTFTDFHIEQFKLARTAFQVEVLQNGLRKQMISVIKASASGCFDDAILLTQDYITSIQKEIEHAYEAAEITQTLLQGKKKIDPITLTRKDVSKKLNITMDTLRNWEMNGLLRVKRKENRYRIYTYEDIERLKIIRTLRCANYSLSAILRMMNALTLDQNISIKEVLNTPDETEDIISVCDRLIISLKDAQKNAEDMLVRLNDMKRKQKK